MPVTTEETGTPMPANEDLCGDAFSFTHSLKDPDLPLRAVYYPLGFPFEIRTDSAEVMKAAEESWSRFEKKFGIPETSIRVVSLSDGPQDCPPPPVVRVHGSLVVNIADAGNLSVSDLDGGHTRMWLTQAAISRRAYMRYFFLESTVYAHIAQRFATGIHAACVCLEGSGMLLCGDSGAGKSSLAWACARRGWTYVTDDASYLVHDRDDHLVAGHCHQVRFRPSASELFPELAGLDITPRAAGKPSIELSVDLAALSFGGIRQAQTASVDCIVFLNRSQPGRASAPAALRSFSRDEARRFMRSSTYGSSERVQRQFEAIEGLLTAEIMELQYRDLDEGVEQLTSLVKGRR